MVVVAWSSRHYRVGGLEDASRAGSRDRVVCRVCRYRLLKRLSYLAVAVCGVTAWLWAVFLTVFLVWTTAFDPDPFIIWLYDWHVYAAGGQDLAARALYLVALELRGWEIPVATYNLPPFSAVWALALLPFPDHIGGIAWITIGMVAWASAWWVGLRFVRIHHAWAWTGIALAAYAWVFYWFGANVLLGNINHLVLGILAGFVVAYARGHQRTAGILLGLAIATKVWPAAVLVVLARERQWIAGGWAICVAALATVLPLAWIGLEAIRPMIAALSLQVPIEPGVAVLWTSAARLTWDWWPAWGSIAVAIALLALPLRGLPAIGMAAIAGITVIPNIWDHYLPTLIFAGMLISGSLWRWRIDPHEVKVARRAFTAS